VKCNRGQLTLLRCDWLSRAYCRRRTTVASADELQVNGPPTTNAGWAPFVSWHDRNLERAVIKDS